jgi:CDP-diacylglycerol--glycerol-3-phosphate 3-phosphatidyltransferase
MFQSLYPNLPNLISSVRILMAPVLIYLAVTNQPTVFIIILIFTGFTDVLDGYLARRLNLVSSLGAQLDSWGDFFIYSTMAISAWLLWPDILIQQKWYVGMIVASFTIPVLIGLIKFRKLTSYHTLSVKAAVAMTIVSYILLFTGIVSWPFKVAALACLLAGVEQILITLFSHKAETVDVKSFWHVLKNRNAQ